MRRFLLLAFLFVAFYSNSVFAEMKFVEDIFVKCKNPYAEGRITGIKQKNAAGSFLVFDSNMHGNDSSYVTSIIPYNVALSKGTECKYSPLAVVGGGVVPAIREEDIASWESFEVSMAKFKQMFSCVCALNANLLNGCKADYMYDDSHENYTEYVSGVCKKDAYGEGHITEWKLYTVYSSSTTSVDPCFVAGVKVSTSSGDKNIEALNVGDEVLSYDHKTNVVKSSKVTKIFKHENKKYGELYLSNGIKLNVTPEHPFYSVDRNKYVKVGKLHPKDKLYVRTSSNKMETVLVDKFIKPVAKTTVYNIEVDGQHNYFADGVLVHNKL